MRSFVPIAFLGGFALAGIVYASIPDSNGLIHGCYAKKGGGLRVIDAGTGQGCNSGKEAPLNWNRSGPPGPSDAYTWMGSENIPGDNTHHDFASASLPPGSFVVSAVLGLTAGSSTLGSFLRCTTLQDGLPIYYGTGAMNIDPSRTVIMPMLGRAILRDAPAMLTLSCWASGGDVSIGAFVVATKIGTIHDL